MDHTRINAGYAWIRVKDSDKLVPGYWDGNKYFTLVGSSRKYPKKLIVNFIRLEEPTYGWA